MNKVIIFSSARSGGNLLDGKFEQYENVKSFGEFFARRDFNKVDDTIFNHNSTHTMSNKFALSLIEDKYRDSYDTMVFRYHNAHFQYSFNDSIYDDIRDFKKILLYRENFLNKMVSLTIASSKSEWHYTDSNRIPSYTDYSIYYSKDKLDGLYNVCKEFYNNMLSIYGDMPIVKYEDLLLMNDIDCIISELGLDTKKIHDNISTHHINKKDDGYKRIINQKELGDYKLILKKTKDGFRFI